MPWYDCVAAEAIGAQLLDREAQEMPLSMNHTAGGGIYDVNNLHLGPASEEALEVGRQFGRLDVAMNYSDTGRLLKTAVRINPTCPNCNMVFPNVGYKPREDGGSLWTCPDCADLFETNAHGTITRK